ncbi:two-component sensor histidine kinase [Desulfoferula mesophila]|uniref:histidine kinase n=2 Tax=Desulfoferula mesophila TaxID=3058419 RepID=A0AAU9F3I6_9BACT|nr:two-component sensor histidine kinase [Desulfoferula mesophilus]
MARKPTSPLAEPTNRLTGLLLVGILLMIMAVIAITTARRMQSTGQLMRHSLATQGELVIKSLEGATRFGMRHHMWGSLRMQSLVEEMLRLPSLASLVVMGPQGEVLAAGVAAGGVDDVPGKALTGLSPEVQQAVDKRQPVILFLGKELVVGRPFEPLADFQRQGRSLPPWANSMDDHMRQMMGQPRGAGRAGGPGGPPPKPGYVLVRLSTESIRVAQGRDLTSSLLLAAVVFFSAAALAAAMFFYTRRRQSELERLREEVAENQHLAAVGRLAGSVAHEVRNPLSALRGLVQYLAKGHEPGTRSYQCAETAVSEVDRLERVVSGLLDYTRPRSPRLIPLDLQESIAGTLRLLADEPRSQGVEVISRLEPNLPLVQADPDQVRQILMNLIINALEANNGKGSVVVSALSLGDQVKVEVQDQGEGIPPGKSEEIFDPFFSTKERGTGLGLAIARRLARGMGGQLTAASLEWQKGSKFTLTLTAEEAKA